METIFDRTILLQGDEFLFTSKYADQPVLKENAAEFVNKASKLGDVWITAWKPEMLANSEAGERLEESGAYGFIHPEPILCAKVSITDSWEKPMDVNGSYSCLIGENTGYGDSGAASAKSYEAGLRFIERVFGRKYFEQDAPITAITGVNGCGLHRAAQRMANAENGVVINTFTTSRARNEFTSQVSLEYLEAAVKSGECIASTGFAQERMAVPIADVKRALSEGRKAFVVVDFAGALELETYFDRSVRIVGVCSSAQDREQKILEKHGISRTALAERAGAAVRQKKLMSICDEIFEF